MDTLLTPILKKYLGSIIRSALMLAVPFFVSQGIWTPDEATAQLTAIAAALTAVSWSLFEKYRSQKKLLTAAAMPAGSTEQDVDLQVQFGTTPTVTLPKDVSPRTFT